MYSSILIKAGILPLLRDDYALLLMKTSVAATHYKRLDSWQGASNEFPQFIYGDLTKIIQITILLRLL